MALISEILARESPGSKRIYFYKEGVFWKAYQRSAFRFAQRNTMYKVKKKFMQTIGKEVISFGFPDTALSKWFAEEQIVWMNDNLIYVVCEEDVNEDEYRKWFESVPLEIQPAKRYESAMPLLREPAMLLFREPGPPVRNETDEIIKKVRDFRLEAATPIECMNFLNEIKVMLN